MANPNAALAGAYMFGADGVPVRAEIEIKGGKIVCTKRSPGPAALSLLWNAGAFGTVMLETTRVQERDRPYVLPAELARGRLMRISQKREDWGLFDYPGADELYARVDQAKDRFIASMTAADEGTAMTIGVEAIRAAAEAGESLSMFHAGIFLDRRKSSKQFGARPLGCGVSLSQTGEAFRSRLIDAFDFVSLPLSWKLLEPTQGASNWDLVDPWVAWAHKNRMAVKASPLVSFYKSDLPDWVFLYEQDFDGVRDLIKAHIRRTVERLGPYVSSWDIVSGLHAHNTFNLSFEQIMELTRLSATLVKQIAPRSTAIVELVAPWGEYYAHNPRTVPPMLFADMAVQSGIPFDAFGLQFCFGAPQCGMYVRDMMQISAMVDRFANLGKPLHVTAVQVPSNVTPDPDDHWKGAHNAADAGCWRGPWTEPIQAEWLQGFLEVVFSKPFVETVCWRDLADTPGHYLPHGGLLRRDFTPKPAYERILAIRHEWFGGRRGTARKKR
ncbi:MAG: endo-1,4-beta-xylanase [Phycisphaerae bacterium]